jgi:hypothetical protein
METASSQTQRKKTGPDYIIIVSLHTAYEDGTDKEFRNVGI